MSKSKYDNIHQLHINIPKSIHNELLTILPEQGMITGLVRRFLRAYVIKIRSMHELTRGPAGDTTDDIIKEDLNRR
jgi:hypothetical protein